MGSVAQASPNFEAILLPLPLSVRISGVSHLTVPLWSLTDTQKFQVTLECSYLRVYKAGNGGVSEENIIYSLPQITFSPLK